MSDHFIGEPRGTVYVKELQSAIVATASSGEICVAGAKAIAIQLIEAGTVNNRSGALTITASVDGGATFRDYSMLISNTSNTNAQNLTRVASVTRNSAGADIVWLTPETLGAITHIKSTVTITDGAVPTGTFTVQASISY